MDTELVNKVVEQVLSALGRQGLTTAAPTSPTNQATSPAPQQEPEQPEGKATPAPTPAPKVFITAEMLSRRLAVGNNGGAIELAHNEFLTPAAADLVQKRNLAIRKTERNTGIPEYRSTVRPEDQRIVGSDISTGGSSDSPSQTPTKTDANKAAIGLVIDRPGEKIGGVIDSLERCGIVFSRFDGLGCWMENVRSMCEAVASGGLAAGVVVMPWAADAMVLANKAGGIRAVQGTRAESVAAGLRHFGANVLVLEHAASTFHEMRSMIRLFVEDRTKQPVGGLLLEAVGRLERS